MAVFHRKFDGAMRIKNHQREGGTETVGRGMGILPMRCRISHGQDAHATE